MGCFPRLGLNDDKEAGVAGWRKAGLRSQGEENKGERSKGPPDKSKNQS